MVNVSPVAPAMVLPFLLQMNEKGAVPSAEATSVAALPMLTENVCE
jgi:hypothetical protein